MAYTQSQLQQIRWRCARRGMKEMDLILTDFFDKEFEYLSEAEQHTFLQLLSESDTTLWDWFFTDIKPPSIEMMDLVNRIK